MKLSVLLNMPYSNQFVQYFSSEVADRQFEINGRNSCEIAITNYEKRRGAMKTAGTTWNILIFQSHKAEILLIYGGK